MKRLFSLSLFVTTVYSLSACNKNDEITNPSPSATEGVLRCTNTSSNSYTVYLDGIYVSSLPGKTFEEYKKKAGTYTVKAEQNEGYILYPTIVERNILITANSQVEFIFP
jgi:hypothetical protein